MVETARETAESKVAAAVAAERQRTLILLWRTAAEQISHPYLVDVLLGLAKDIQAGSEP